LRAHPGFDADFSEIDLRESEDLGLKAADFLNLADEIDCFEREAWCTFVLHNSVQDHAARLRSILRPKGNTKIFLPWKRRGSGSNHAQPTASDERNSN
jgi:hypothetical protein